MSHTIYNITLKQARKDLRKLGYKLKIKNYSNFSAAVVTHVESGAVVSGFNVFGREFLDQHKAYLDYKNNHKVVDDGWRTII